MDKLLMQTKAISQKGISGSTLKIMAIVTMLIDHIGAAVLGPYISIRGDTVTDVQTLYVIYMVFRIIGRIAFPIFCFLLVEGFLHTKNKMKYAGRLFLFALISEIPFDYAFYQTPFYLDHQNVFFTLWIGLCTLIAIERIFKQKYLYLIPIFIGCFCAYYLRTDYGAFGVAFIVILYNLRGQKMVRNIICSIAIIGFAWQEISAPLAFIPIQFYNGKRGLSLKYVFYLFYPLHLAILGLVYQQFFS